MSQPTSASRKSSRWRRVAAWIGLAMLLGLVGSEWFLKSRYGLGRPVMTIDDPQTEYRIAPEQHLTRLGNRIDVNGWSMRSDDFPEHKADPREVRILFIGDSILFGGTLSDQRTLASELVKKALSEELARPVVVGNVSAGSWGPENLLAFIRKFGRFDADLFVVVVSSHDAMDKIGPLPATESKPASSTFAWAEVGSKVIARFFPASPPRDAPAIDEKTPHPDCLAAFAELLRTLDPGRTIVVQHYEKAESAGNVKPGNAALKAIAEREGATAILQDGPALFASLDAGNDPWRDEIHINDAGQRILADLVLPPLRMMIRSLPTTGPATMSP